MSTALDPRQGSEDIRPVVAKAQRRAPTWLLVGAVVIAGLGLFVFLEGRRQAATAPTVEPVATEVIMGTAAPPPLFVPIDPQIEAPQPLPLASEPPPPPPPPYPMPTGLVTSAAPPPLTSAPAVNPAPPTQIAASNAERGTVQTAEQSSAPALVIDTTSVPAETAAAEGGAAGANTSSAVRTSRIRRPSSTVLQGTLIPAVLETALDSSRPGQVRAIVSRDITGFDGSRVLIPRGSRLVGNYEADLTDGQSRAFVEWTRLVRPDGVSIALGSPAADLQGRAGVPGRVNSRFLARFGSALLQTTLNLGASAAGRSLGGESSVVVALPGATQNLGASPAASTIRPTLNVAAGARVSVFVARDLEFSSGTPR